jgi:hypothetical protein
MKAAGQRRRGPFLPPLLPDVAPGDTIGFRVPDRLFARYRPIVKGKLHAEFHRHVELKSSRVAEERHERHPSTLRYPGFRFPAEIIGHVVGLYHRFTSTSETLKICWLNVGLS